MTQVTGLGMGNLAVAKTTKDTKASEQGAGLAEQFASLMNQNTKGYLSLGTDRNQQSLQVNGADSSRQNYEKFSGSTRKISQADAGTSKSAMQELTQKAETLVKEVKDTVQETFDVSDEELEQAMEVLGVNALDLLNPQNLMQLVQQLTGDTDAGALLLNEGVQDLMQNVSSLMDAFMQDNGLDRVQMDDLLSQLSTQVDAFEQLVRDRLNLDDGTSAVTDVFDTQEAMQTLDDVPTEDTTAATDVFSSVLRGQDSEQSVQTPQPQTTEEDGSLMQDLNHQVQSDEAGAQTGEDTAGDLSQGSSFDTSEDTGFDALTDVKGDTQAAMFRQDLSAAAQAGVEQVQQAVPQTDQMLQIESLMNQMEGLAHAFASGEETTLQMQLNPESLGRLVLTVTEKHGNVTAQIAATNEQVKEALQTQLVQLHETLQSQGIKVEAVEVTVATHEFEQNLDGNASANAQLQQGEQQNRQGQGGRRNLDRSSLETLGGQMSDEEALAAQIMRDNGGNVDYTA